MNERLHANLILPQAGSADGACHLFSGAANGILSVAGIGPERSRRWQLPIEDDHESKERGGCNTEPNDSDLDELQALGIVGQHSDVPSSLWTGL